MDDFLKICLDYWPVGLSLVVTWGIVHSAKYFIRHFGESKRRWITRLVAFVVGFVVAYVSLRAFTGMQIKQVQYMALFVGLSNPSIYWAAMLYLRVKKPETYASLADALKHHNKDNGVEEFRDEDNRLEKIHEHGKTVWRRDKD